MLMKQLERIKIDLYGQKFSKSVHDCRDFYAIRADFDADRRKKMTILRQF